MKPEIILPIALLGLLTGIFMTSESQGSVPNPVTGSIIVSDSNSLGTDLVIGDSSLQGALSITSGGIVQNLNGYRGADPTVGGNTVQVLGSALWNNDGDLYVGASGPSNSLLVTRGGSVVSTGVAYLRWDETINNTLVDPLPERE